jgi:hypothetical protein
MLLGIRRQYRGLGLDAVLCSELHRAVVDLGLKRAEIGWTSENNMQVNRAIEAMNGRRAKSYRVYRRGVGAVS